MTDPICLYQRRNLGPRIHQSFLTLFQTTNLDSSKFKEFADISFTFDENSGEFSKRVEDTVGKREIARYEQFLSF